MNTLQIFNDSQFGDIRVSTDETGEPLFCLADLCRVLGISNARNVKTRLDDEDVHSMDTPTNSGIQNMSFVTESGMYDVIIRSDSPLAKPMQRWVTSEVLPAIRKHGVYATESVIERVISDPDSFIKVLTELRNERLIKKQLEQDNLIQQIQLEAQAGKVFFANAVATSESSVLVSELANLISQTGIKIGQNRLFRWMHEYGYLCYHVGNNNQPSQKSMELKLFEIKELRYLYVFLHTP